MSIVDSAKVLIASDVQRPTELVFGSTSNFIVGQETNFNGYIKEFRLWKKMRTEFYIKNLRYVSFKIPSEDLIAYWKLDEINDGTVTLF